MTETETHDEMIDKTEIPEMPDRLIKQSFAALEHNYDISQRAKMEAIHNAVIAVIQEQQARPEHVLLTLEIVRIEIVNSCVAQFFAPSPAQVPEPESEDSGA